MCGKPLGQGSLFTIIISYFSGNTTLYYLNFVMQPLLCLSHFIGLSNTLWVCWLVMGHFSFTNTLPSVDGQTSVWHLLSRPILPPSDLLWVTDEWHCPESQIESQIEQQSWKGGLHILIIYEYHDKQNDWLSPLALFPFSTYHQPLRKTSPN